MQRVLKRGRQLAGVLVRDWRRYERALSASDDSYLSICNRDERVERSADGRGYRCLWPWTSSLHAPKLIPSLGRRLSARALVHHPVRRSAAPVGAENPDISFIIGHRGAARIPHLLATLESIAGQQGAAIECIVVEQDEEDNLSGVLPAWVRHVRTPPPKGMPYCRAWAFNIGAAHARSELLVLHDNDMLVSADHAAEALRVAQAGYRVANLKRFVFYLSEQHSARVFAGESDLAAEPPEQIVQNLEGGGSVAIERKAYFEIGGLDESFIGWGGEDNEFWERAKTLGCWEFGFLPIWHLWHAAQPRKEDAANETRARFLELSRIDPAARIERLREIGFGNAAGPVGAWSASVR